MDKHLIKVEEMAAILGVPVSWLYQRTRLSPPAIPFLRVGRYVRFDAEKVLSFLETQSAGQAGQERIS